MTDAPFPPPAPPAPPAERQPRRFSRTQRMVMAGGLAVGLALGGAGISFAASSGTSSTTAPPNSPTPSAPLKPGDAPRPFARGLGGFGAFGGLGRVVHGEATVRTSSGYQKIVFQVGTAATAGSSSGITVTSPDGYSQTYTVNSQTIVNAQVNGISSVKKGDQVQVIANQSNTAERIVDVTGLKNSRAGFGFGPESHGSKPAGSPRTAEAGAFGAF